MTMPISTADNSSLAALVSQRRLERSSSSKNHMKSSFSTPSLVGREKADSEKLSAGGWLQAAQTLNAGAKGSPGSQSTSFQKIRIGRHDQSLPLMGRTNTTARMKGSLAIHSTSNNNINNNNNNNNNQWYLDQEIFNLWEWALPSDIREWHNVLRWRERQQQNLQRQLVHLATNIILLDLTLLRKAKQRRKRKSSRIN